MFNSPQQSSRRMVRRGQTIFALVVTMIILGVLGMVSYSEFSNTSPGAAGSHISAANGGSTYNQAAVAAREAAMQAVGSTVLSQAQAAATAAGASSIGAIDPSTGESYLQDALGQSSLSRDTVTNAGLGYQITDSTGDSICLPEIGSVTTGSC